MAVTTVTMSISGPWTQLSTGDLDVMVQLQSPGTIEIVVAAAEPASTAGKLGVFLSDKAETVFSITGMDASDNVYARVPGGTTEEIGVMKAPQPA